MNPCFPSEVHQILAQARREAPIFFCSQLNCWVVTRHEDVLSVLRNPAVFSSAGTMDPIVQLPAEVQTVLQEGYPLVPILFSTDPPRHTRLRAILSEAFSPDRIAAMEPAIRRLAHSLIDGFIREGRADIMKRFAYPLPLYVITDMLRVPRGDAEMIKSLHNDLLQLWFNPALPLEQQLDCARSVVAYQRYYAELVTACRASPGDDLLSAMTRARVDGEEPLSTAEVVWHMILLLSAAHETTQLLITSTLLQLLEHPAEASALEGNPQLLAAAIEETIRLEPPQSMSPRVTTRPVEIGGVSLPEGACVYVSFASANRDDAAISRPDERDVHRQRPGNHLGFGAGSHFCLGAPLARLEGRVAVEAVRERLHNLRVLPGFVPEYSPLVFQRGVKALHLQWDPVQDQSGS